MLGATLTGTAGMRRAMFLSTRSHCRDLQDAGVHNHDLCACQQARRLFRILDTQHAYQYFDVAQTLAAFHHMHTCHIVFAC
jgi:hypothetical protein